MSTGRELAYEHLRIIVPLTMVLWRGVQASLEERVSAMEQLNTRLGLALCEIDSYYDEELIALLRSTSSVKHLIANWNPLLASTRAVFESRHGMERTKGLLVGMI